ncbi:MAG: exonuclease [Armatimonadetes bacterium]|nr:exonuclease [Armatimonadota bacterium]
MLGKTFVHVPGVGEKTEHRLWGQGAHSWEHFLAEPTRFPLPDARLAEAIEIVSRSLTARQRLDHRFFAERLKPGDHWRALPEFADRTAYLDIETDGGRGPDCVTVIGLYRKGEVQQFIRGENLLAFPDALEEVSLLVTFFGTGFDLPVLRETFPRLRFEQLHVDLCPTLRRLGFRGGLKRIERELGIGRSGDTVHLVGSDAPRLWSEWLWGHRESRDRLLRYNAEDIVNLAPLAELAYERLARKLEAGGAD